MRKLLDVLLVLATALLVGWSVTEAQAAPDLNDGRVRVFVGRPLATPAMKPRRIYPTGVYPRGVTLVPSRASTPGAWYAWEYDRIRAFAKKRKYITWTLNPTGFDITPGVSGREYRVHAQLLAAINQTARAKLAACHITSGWRDSTKQLFLYQMWLSGVPGYNPANAPGTSKHEALPGLPARAADVTCNGLNYWTWTRRVGAPIGKLTQPYKHEPWHVEAKGL